MDHYPEYGGAFPEEFIELVKPYALAWRAKYARRYPESAQLDPSLVKLFYAMYQMDKERLRKQIEEGVDELEEPPNYLVRPSGK